MIQEQLELFDNLDLELKIMQLEKTIKHLEEQNVRYRQVLSAFALGNARGHSETFRIIASNALKK